jgi:hypothetical protein
MLLETFKLGKVKRQEPLKKNLMGCLNSIPFLGIIQCPLACKYNVLYLKIIQIKELVFDAEKI